MRSGAPQSTWWWRSVHINHPTCAQKNPWCFGLRSEERVRVEPLQSQCRLCCQAYAPMRVLLSVRGAVVVPVM